MWYTCFGTMTTVLIAIVASFIVGSIDPATVDKKLLAPCIRKYVPDALGLVKKVPPKKTLADAIPELEEENCIKESVL